MALVALSSLTALPAFAHAQLVDASPGIGSRLHVAPARVTLTFDDYLIDLGSSTANIITVTNHVGTHFETGNSRLAGATLSVDVLDLSTPDTYTVTYSVVSADGHPVSASYQFEILGSPSSSLPDPASSKSVEPRASHSSKSANSTRPPVGAVTHTDSVAPDVNGRAADAADVSGTTVLAFGLLSGVSVLLATLIALIALFRRSQAKGK